MTDEPLRLTRENIYKIFAENRITFLPYINDMEQDLYNSLYDYIKDTFICFPIEYYYIHTSNTVFSMAFANLMIRLTENGFTINELDDEIVHEEHIGLIKPTNGIVIEQEFYKKKFKIEGKTGIENLVQTTLTYSDLFRISQTNYNRISTEGEQLYKTIHERLYQHIKISCISFPITFQWFYTNNTRTIDVFNAAWELLINHLKGCGFEYMKEVDETIRKENIIVVDGIFREIEYSINRKKLILF